MKNAFEFIKENRISYLLAMTIAPILYIILDLIPDGKVVWFGAIMSSILAGIIYTILKLWDIKRSDK